MARIAVQPDFSPPSPPSPTELLDARSPPSLALPKAADSRRKSSNTASRLQQVVYTIAMSREWLQCSISNVLKCNNKSNFLSGRGACVHVRRFVRVAQLRRVPSGKREADIGWQGREMATDRWRVSAVCLMSLPNEPLASYQPSTGKRVE